MFMICSWLAHYLFISFSLLVHCFFKTCTYVVHNMLMTSSWLLNIIYSFWQLLKFDLFLTCSWHVHTLFTIYDLFTTCSLLLPWITSLTVLYLPYFPFPLTTSLVLHYLSYLTWTILLKLFRSKFFTWTNFTHTTSP